MSTEITRRRCARLVFALYYHCMQQIEFYSDYRKYLSDFYEDQKKRHPYFSYRYFCRKAGISSPSLFKEVVSGKRNLTSDTIDAFARGLGLTERETQYFTALVQFNQARSGTDKQLHLDAMRRLKTPIRQHKVAIDDYAYYASWYNPVVRDLACSVDWHGDYALLAKCVCPRITARQARESMTLLLDLGFLVRGDDGRYRQAHPAITTGSEVVATGVRGLNREMARLGVAAIDEFPPSQRDISSAVIGVSEESYRQIKQEIQAFKRRVFQIVDDDAATDRVYNLNVHLFPVSEPGKDGRR
ncbi:MAG: TIGR02147 family protein [Chitinivibrionales bacterium]|nr:TIGR02147 family protein [Chitinivibrionales bacterium]